MTSRHGLYIVVRADRIGTLGSPCSKQPKSVESSRRATTRRRCLDCGRNCSPCSRSSAQASFPVIVLFAGVDTAGKGETVNLLNEWMDPRWIVTRGYTEPSSEERERPRLWRYWRDLPPRGRLAMFLSAWYSSPILDRVAGRLSTAEFDSLLDQVAAFERALTDDGAVIVKFWMHLSKRRRGSG